MLRANKILFTNNTFTKNIELLDKSRGRLSGCLISYSVAGFEPTTTGKFVNHSATTTHSFNFRIRMHTNKVKENQALCS